MCSVSIDIKENAITNDDDDAIKNPSEVKLITNSQIINLRLPKCLRIEALCDSSTKVITEAIVYKSPTYFSLIKLTRNVEFTYAERDMWSVNKNDRRYIRFILVSLIVAIRLEALV